MGGVHKRTRKDTQGSVQQGSLAVDFGMEVLQIFWVPARVRDPRGSVNLDALAWSLANGWWCFMSITAPQDARNSSPGGGLQSAINCVGARSSMLELGTCMTENIGCEAVWCCCKQAHV